MWRELSNDNMYVYQTKHRAVFIRMYQRKDFWQGMVWLNAYEWQFKTR